MRSFILFVLLALVIAGCSGSTPTAVPTPTPEPEPCPRVGQSFVVPHDMLIYGVDDEGNPDHGDYTVLDQGAEVTIHATRPYYQGRTHLHVTASGEDGWIVMSDDAGMESDIWINPRAICTS